MSEHEHHHHHHEISVDAVKGRAFFFGIILNTLLRADNPAGQLNRVNRYVFVCASQWVREDAPEQNPARSEKHLHGERFMAGLCDDRIQRTMILALAIRHRMERPAISMEGGKSLWSSPASCRLLEL